MQSRSEALCGSRKQAFDMAKLYFSIVILSTFIHTVLSQTCPSGTPEGCTCGNSVFSCSGLGISEVPSSISSLAESMEYNVIDLSNNTLASVPTGSFKELQNIHTIILSRNQITVIEPGAFDMLESLVRVDLQRNRLAALEQTGFSQVTVLRELLLAGNPLMCDSNIFWLKAWEDSVSNNPILTGNCAFSPGTSITEYLGDASISESGTVLSFEADTFSGVEGDGAVSVVVLRRGMSSNRIQFNLNVIEGTATVNEDYSPVSMTTQTMLEGQTRMSIQVLLMDDATMEPDETFSVSIGVREGREGNVATVAQPNPAVLTIIDDDAIPEPETTAEPTKPEPEPTQHKPEPTQPKPEPTMKTNSTRTPQAVSRRVNVAAIVVPIIIILVIIAVIVAFYFYKQNQAASKASTAGVRYAAVQNKGKVYGEVTTKA